MEQQALVIDALVVNFNRDRLSAVRARGLDPTIRMQGSTDAGDVERSRLSPTRVWVAAAPATP